MPELPEVQCVVNSLSRLKGKAFRSVSVVTPTLRCRIPESFASLVTGRKIIDVFRRGKCIVFQLDVGFIVCHLGMTGKLVINAKSAKHDHVLFEFEDGGTLFYNDPRKFGFVVYERSLGENTHLAGLGIDALSTEFDGEWLWAKIQRARRDIKTLLLDQKVISGLGNIYVLEVLYLCRISPLRVAGSLTRAQVDHLVVEIKKILLASIAMGGSSISDYRDADNQKGDFQSAFNVYERKVDPEGNPVLWISQKGRGTYYSPSVQL